MSGYPLQAVLDLRRREEAAAARALADASRRRAEAEAGEKRMVSKVNLARQRLESAQQNSGPMAVDERGNSPATRTGAAAAAAAVFVGRRRDELRSTQLALAQFQEVTLAPARTAETAARNRHFGALRAREAFEKHEKKYWAARHRESDRREDEAVEETARATWQAADVRKRDR